MVRSVRAVRGALCVVAVLACSSQKDSLLAQKSEVVQYRVLATNKTSTMQKEITEAAEAGFVFTGITVGNTGFGGREVVLITQRQLPR